MGQMAEGGAEQSSDRAAAPPDWLQAVRKVVENNLPEAPSTEGTDGISAADVKRLRAPRSSRAKPRPHIGTPGITKPVRLGR
jgi:hypothetical protein